MRILIYATVHKTRQGSQIIKVECKVIHGTEQHVIAQLAESPSQTINTAYIERSNLDWQLWDAHLTRKAPTGARSMRWLKAKFAICVSSYNLIRPHETLSRGGDRIFRPNTPAMTANVADHPWTFSELLAYPALCQRYGDITNISAKTDIWVIDCGERMNEAVAAHIRQLDQILPPGGR